MGRKDNKKVLIRISPFDKSDLILPEDTEVRFVTLIFKDGERIHNLLLLNFTPCCDCCDRNCIYPESCGKAKDALLALIISPSLRHPCGTIQCGDLKIGYAIAVYLNEKSRRCRYTKCIN